MRKTMSTKEEIFEKVREVIVDALGVDEDKVTPEAVLTDDLGAERIDFPDLAFRLEQAFRVQVPRGRFDLSAVERDPACVRLGDGTLTDQGIQYLQEQLPWGDFGSLAKSPRNVHALLTVRAICAYMETLLTPVPA